MFNRFYFWAITIYRAVAQVRRRRLRISFMAPSRQSCQSRQGSSP